MQKVDILFTTPQYTEIDAVPRIVESTLPGLSSIKAYLNQVGISSAIIDPYAKQCGLEETMEMISRYDTGVYGISATYLDMGNLRELATAIKHYNQASVIIVGGWISPYYEEVLTIPAVNIVVVGQGEFPMKELMPAVFKKKDFSHIRGTAYGGMDGNIIYSGPRTDIISVDDALVPDISNNPPFEHNGNVIVNYRSSEGCMFHCKFCTISQMHRKYRERSAVKVASDLQYYFERYPAITLVSLSDDMFVPLRLPPIFEECDKRGLPKFKMLFQSTAYHVDKSQRVLRDPSILPRIHRCDIGIEGFGPSLRYLDKPATPELNWRAVEFVNEVGIDALAYTIIESNLKDLVETRDYYIHPYFWPLNVWMNNLVVFPYTRLAAEGHRKKAKPWQVAFQIMMKPFHQRRISLVNLSRFYDRALKEQKARADSDPNLMEKYRSFERKSAIARGKINSIAGDFFDEALSLAVMVEFGQVKPQLELFDEHAVGTAKRIDDRIEAVQAFIASGREEF